MEEIKRSCVAPINPSNKKPWGYIVIPVYSPMQTPLTIVSAGESKTPQMAPKNVTTTLALMPPASPSSSSSLSGKPEVFLSRPTSPTLITSVATRNIPITPATTRIRSTSPLAPIITNIPPKTSSLIPLSDEELLEARRRADRERANKRKPPCTLASNTPEILKPRRTRRHNNNKEQQHPQHPQHVRMGNNNSNNHHNNNHNGNNQSDQPEYTPLLFFPTGVPPAIRKDAHSHYQKTRQRFTHSSLPRFKEIHNDEELDEGRELPPLSQMALMADLVAMGVPGEKVDGVMDRILRFCHRS